jgi:hypothetical protein
MIFILFCAFGGAYILYAVALALGGIGLWKYSRRQTAQRWLFSAVICLMFAMATHWFTVAKLPHIFAGAITG